MMTGTKLDRRLQLGKVLVKYSRGHETNQQGDSYDDHEDVVKLANHRGEVWNEIERQREIEHEERNDDPDRDGNAVVRHQSFRKFHFRSPRERPYAARQALRTPGGQAPNEKCTARHERERAKEHQQSNQPPLRT